MPCEFEDSCLKDEFRGEMFIVSLEKDCGVFGDFFLEEEVDLLFFFGGVNVTSSRPPQPFSLRKTKV